MTPDQSYMALAMLFVYKYLSHFLLDPAVDLHRASFVQCLKRHERGLNSFSSPLSWEVPRLVPRLKAHYLLCINSQTRLTCHFTCRQEQAALLLPLQLYGNPPTSFRRAVVVTARHATIRNKLEKLT